jgi:hypothetical protein
METTDRNLFGVRVSLALLAVGCALAIVGCGSSGRPTKAATSSAYAHGLKHADCMRLHGVPGFPDPSPDGATNLNIGSGSGVNVQSPAFRSALLACQSLAPNGGAFRSLSESQKLVALKFSQCMRAHGLRSYPDPQFSAIGYRLTLPPGVNPNSPAFRNAETACDSSTGVGSGNSGSG